MPGQDSKERNFQDDIFPLSVIPDHWLLVSKRLSENLSDAEIGPVHALHATMVMFKNLYYLEDERWLKIRDSLKLGLVKDTKKYGNTSVSMGAARRFFEKNPTQKSVGFLNCGTGGIKYQRYESQEVLHVSGEHKPKDAASPNCLKISAFTPKTVVSFEDTTQLLSRDLSAAAMPWKQDEGLPVFAFITGTVRQYWEDAKPDEKKVLEETMGRLFQPHKIQPMRDSYFVTQDEEGALELFGVQALYANLAKFGLIDAGIQIVGSFGIGRGSCQWMLMRKNGTPELVGHKAGMVNVKALGNMSNTLMDACKDQNKFDVMLGSLEGIKNPAVALKSGAGLMLDMKEHAHLKAELTKPPESYPKRTVKIATIEAPNRVLSITWMGSLDRLCAEAKYKLKSEHELGVVYREKQGKLEALERDTEILPNEVLILGPIEIYGTSAATTTTATADSVAAPTSPVRSSANPRFGFGSGPSGCVLL